MLKLGVLRERAVIDYWHLSFCHVKVIENSILYVDCSGSSIILPGKVGQKYSINNIKMYDELQIARRKREYPEYDFM